MARFKTDLMHLKPGTLPVSPETGDIAVDSNDNNAYKYYNGTEWINLEKLDESTVDLGTLENDQILVYGYDGYGYWTNVNAIDYFEALGFASNIISVTDDTTLTNTNDTVIVNNTTNTTISLPSASERPGKIYHIKRIGSENVIVDPDGTETIDGGLTAVLTVKYECLTIQSDGSNWWIL